MVGNQEGIGTLKLECPQGHPVGRILKEAPHQAVQYDPGARLGHADSGRTKTSSHNSKRTVASATNRWEMPRPRCRAKLATLVADACRDLRKPPRCRICRGERRLDL